jgi:hypothetical protein
MTTQDQASGWTDHEQYEVGKYYEWTEDRKGGHYGSPPDGFIRCTYDADIIIALPSQNWSENQEKTVFLPAPEHFQGKTVEISSSMYNINGAKTYYVGCVEDDRFAHMMNIDQYGRVVRSSTSTLSRLTLNAGGFARFHSTRAFKSGTGDVYYWLDVTGAGT